MPLVTHHAGMLARFADLRRWPRQRWLTVRVDWPDRWFHVRVSQTEPVVRIISERRGEAPRELHDAVIEQVRSFA